MGQADRPILFLYQKLYQKMTSWTWNLCGFSLLPFLTPDPFSALLSLALYPERLASIVWHTHPTFLVRGFYLDSATKAP